MTRFWEDSSLTARAKHCIYNFVMRFGKFKNLHEHFKEVDSETVKKVVNKLMAEDKIRSDLKGLSNCGVKTRNEILAFIGRPPLEVTHPRLSYKTLKEKIKSLEDENARLRESLRKVYDS